MIPTMTDYHVPVLLQESVKGLNIQPNGIYVDVTFGGGGHSREILDQLQKGRLIAFDQDADAGDNRIDDERFEIVDQNFRYLRNNLRIRGVEKVDGVLADLGVSSHQFNVPERGFSFRFEAPLDMRMDQHNPRTAAQVLQESDEQKLADIFYHFGELRNARAVAAAVVVARESGPMKTVQDLINSLKHLEPGYKPHQFYAKVFQALRIEVNDEMAALSEMLKQAIEVLKIGGRLSVISYHSLEDRMVKNYFRFGNPEGEPQKDFYGNLHRPMKVINKKPIGPTDEEIKVNNRARSARLRIAEKL